MSRMWGQKTWHKAVQLGLVHPELGTERVYWQRVQAALGSLAQLSLAATAAVEDGKLDPVALRAIAVPLVLLFGAAGFDLEEVFDQEVFAFESIRLPDPGERAVAPTARELRPYYAPERPA